MTIDNHGSQDGANPENAGVEKPEQGLIEDRELETISGGGIIYKSPSPPGDPQPHMRRASMSIENHRPEDGANPESTELRNRSRVSSRTAIWIQSAAAASSINPPALPRSKPTRERASMSIENHKPEDGPNSENAHIESPEHGLIRDPDLEAISGGIIYKAPSPPEGLDFRTTQR